MGDDDALTGADAAVFAAAAGVAALAAFGISKWFGSSKPEPKRQEKMIGFSSSSSSRLTNNSHLMDGYTPGCGIREDLGDSSKKDAKWKKPKPGWYKLNTDGSVRKQPFNNTGTATAGGLIRDHNGVWIVGFAAKLEDCDSISSELQAIKLGLELAWKNGYEFKKLELETDCDEAVRLILYDSALDLDKDELGSLVSDCRKLVSLGVTFNDPAVERCQNNCADRLTKVPIPPGKWFYTWETVSDLPRTHFDNVNVAYLADLP